jgi:hypothetical protein
MFDSYNNATRRAIGRRGAAPTRVANRCGKINLCFHRSAARRSRRLLLAW